MNGLLSTGATKVVAFVAGCAALFTAALGVGHLVGPVAAEPARSDGHDMGGMSGSDQTEAADHHGVAGLEAASGGYAIELAADRLPAGRQPLRFTIAGAEGHPVTAYDEQHGRDLHLVVVRRDLTGFQHVHPTLDGATGEWTADVDLTPGAWRVLADFLPSGGSAAVLGTDLLVGGEFAPEPLGGDRLDASVDGYDVTVGGSLAGGRDTELTATVMKDGLPVTDLEPYLGAYGHLVALRDGDLGYLHVHPDEDTGPGPAISFHTEFPTAGRYRLFLDFSHGGQVRTAAFTVTVEGGGHDH